MREVLDAALNYAKTGRPVFPVESKKPLIPGGFKAATTDEATIRDWWERWPNADVATPTGGDLFVLDVDDPAALDKLVAEHGALPPTREVTTPRGGRHLYLRGDDIRSRVGAPATGLDVRGDGGYVVIPPSTGYEWRNRDEDVAPAPAWLLELLKVDRGRNGSNGTGPIPEAIPEGQRNATLASLAGTMRRRGAHEAAIVAALLVTNRDRCKPPLYDSEVRGVAHSIARYRPEAEAEAKLDDLADLFNLGAIRERIARVEVYGRGTGGGAYLHLEGGSVIEFDPLRSVGSAAKMSQELATQAGVSATLKAVDVTKAFALIYWLGEHHKTTRMADMAWELGADYLRTAAEAEVDMGDQMERWRAFSYLSESGSSDVVLLDRKAGRRYVRTKPFVGYLRANSAPGEHVEHLAALERDGWTRSGTLGRIKATQPGGRRTLAWAFHIVPVGWGDEHE